jgi:ectoine hydroxylase-related dioxygenase (phytanoyl-CoA dioxygenase family)
MAVAGDLDQEIFEFDTYGFVVLERVIDEAAAAGLATQLSEMDEAVGRDYVHDGAFARHITSVYAGSDFMALIDHPKVLGFIEAVMGPDLVLGSFNARIVRPGDPDQGLHGDIPFQLRRPGPPVMVNAVWMFDEFTAENGATRFVPGSHRAADASPPPGRHVPHEVVAAGPAGSVLIFNGQCWHGGGGNRSDDVRRAAFAHYRVAPWMRFAIDPRQHVDAARWPELTERQRRLLRMEAGPDQPTAADYYPASTTAQG